MLPETVPSPVLLLRRERHECLKNGVFEWPDLAS